MLSKSEVKARQERESHQAATRCCEESTAQEHDEPGPTRSGHTGRNYKRVARHEITDRGSRGVTDEGVTHTGVNRVTGTGARESPVT